MSNATENIKVKKVFQPLVDFLIHNKGKKVSTILNDIIKMTAAKVQTKTSITDEDGNVIAIFCYYHKQWERLDEVEYGRKASSSTGYNTMCKIGVSKWTKQQRAIKAVGSKLISMLENGEIEPNDLADVKEALLKEAKQVDDSDKPKGYATEEEARQAN